MAAKRTSIQFSLTAAEHRRLREHPDCPPQKHGKNAVPKFYATIFREFMASPQFRVAELERTVDKQAAMIASLEKRLATIEKASQK